MSQAMTKRERVERTMAFRETDRVPLYDLLRCDSAFEHFSGEKLPVLSDDAETRETVSRIAGKAVGGFLDMTRSFGFGPVVDRDFTNEFGFVMHDAVFEKTCWIVKRPFEDETGAAEYLKKLILKLTTETSEINASSRTYGEKFRRSFLATQARIGDTVNLLTEQGVGLDDVRHNLGLEIFSYLYADDPGLVSEALETYTLRNLAICHAIADTALSPAVLTYGDIACKNRLLHSPGFLQKEFFPRLKRLNDAWHEHGFKCLFHSDGYLMEIMDDLIAAGIDGLNPIETVAGMSLKEVRGKYGNKLFLAGGIDMSQLLSRGTPAQVEKVCRQSIRDAYPGYFMGSTTEADNSCKLENLIAVHEVAMEGR